MATVSALDLAGQLGGSTPMPVYVLVGEDEALRSRSLRLLLDHLAPDDQPGSTVKRIEGVPEARDVFDELRTVPFMGMAGRRVVIVEDGDAFLRAHGKRLCRYLERPGPTGTVILLTTKLDRRLASTGAVESNGPVIDCSTVKWRDAESWLRSTAREMGSPITPDAAKVLIESVGPNLLALQTELEKLSAYCDSGAQITVRDVDDVVPQARSRSVFELGDLLARRDAAGALQLCERLLLAGEAPAGIVAVLARQVRQLWQIKRLHEDGASQQQIGRATRLPGFVIRRGVRTAGQLPETRLAEQLTLLADADYQLKTASIRSGEERVWVEDLVVRLCGAKEAGSKGSPA